MLSTGLDLVFRHFFEAAVVAFEFILLNLADCVVRKPDTILFLDLFSESQNIIGRFNSNPTSVVDKIPTDLIRQVKELEFGLTCGNRDHHSGHGVIRHAHLVAMYAIDG